MDTTIKTALHSIDVLLVEDSPTEAMIIQASLEDAEGLACQIVHVTDMAQTLEQLASQRFDIVVLDLTLPDSSGIDTFIRVHTEYPETPVVILTANYNKEMALQTVEMGAQDYIVKEQVENMQLALSLRYAITRSEAEAKQKALLDELGRVNNELESFAYIVSHDLKAPLRGIRTVADWLITDYGEKLGDNGRDQMDLLMGRVDRMHDLIEGVLRYSRAGRVREENREIDLPVLLGDIIDTLAPPAHITVTVDDSMPNLFGESIKITQVFQNLISNAIKYLDKEEGKVQVSCTEEGSFWKFAVSDNGPGIPPKHFQRIFDMFTTLHAKDEYETTGVGLAIVQKIITAAGGCIWVESEAEQGSTFLFTWPQAGPVVAGAETETKG